MKLEKILKNRYAIILLIAVACIVLVSCIQTKYVIRVIDLALIYSISTFSLLLMLGMGGQMIFSQVAFMGVGAYVVANLCSGRLGFYVGGSLALLVAIFIGGLVAFIFGLPLLRLSGTFFTFATIGLVQIFFTFFQNYVPAFGGPAGIAGIKPWVIFGYEIKGYLNWFYVLFVIVFIVMFLLDRVRHSQFGRQLSAIRDNEMAARTLGINVYWTRVKAFTLCGMLGALSGGLLALQSQYIAADNFSYRRASTFVIMAMLGGVNNAAGIVVGSVLITFLPEVLRGLDKYLMLIYGFLIIILMIAMPMGLAGVVTKLLKKKRRARSEKITSNKPQP